MKITIPYKPRPLQREFHNKLKRWNVLITHRRFGKSICTINQLIKSVFTCKEQNPRFAYIAPTYKQAKDIIFDYLKYYSLPIPQIKINESELRVDYPNGGRIRLYGADNPDALRGIYLDGVALDEYAQIKPNLFTEIIRPSLADRKGYAIFAGTPKGKGHFYDLYIKALEDENWSVFLHKASETNYVDKDELEEAKKIMTKDEYEQEFECSWTAAIKGTFYGDEIKKAKEDNRICKVPYDSNLEVHTAWDIGWKDDTSIVFWQQLGKEIRIIDCHSDSGNTVADYATVLREKGYKYGRHYFPHDAFAKRMNDGKSVVDFAYDYGITADRTPQLTVLEGINQARRIFNNIWFDEDKCYQLINALSMYRREYDDKKQTFRANPLHDINSHYADSFRYFAISYNEDVIKDQFQKPVDVPNRGAFLLNRNKLTRGVL